MAMNLLKILNPTGFGDSNSSSTYGGGYANLDGRGDPSSTTAAAARAKKRVYTPAELELMKQMQFLCTKMETLTLPEDRRTTMEQLTQLVRDHPELPIDAAGLRTLMTLSRSIQADRHSSLNIDLSLQAVEILKIQLTPQQGALGASEDTNAAAAGDNSTATAASNASLVSLFVQNPSYITSLLELLGEKHSVLRLYTIQCLTSLLMVRTEKIQSIVLNYPMGVILLVELLSDPSEVIRNETLLLLEALTRSNQAIQKIVAFNGAFDKLMIIAEEEQQSNGGIIAIDAMRLVISLLAENSSNQFLFMEQGCVRRLLPYLSFKAGDLNDDSGPGFEFLGLTLEILNHLVSCLDFTPSAPSHKNTSTRSALTPLIPALLTLACGQPPAQPPLALRHDCWALLAMIVEQHTRNQAILEEFPLLHLQEVPGPSQLQFPGYAHDAQQNPYIAGPPVMKQVKLNTLKHLLELTCETDDTLERFLLLNLFRCYFSSNSSGQLKAMMSFAPSPSAMARGGTRQQHMNGSGQGGEHHSQDGSSSLQQNGIQDEFESGPILGSTLLAMLVGSRPPPASFQAGPEGLAFIDRTRWIASKVMEYMLHENHDGQVMLLTLPLTDPTGMQQGTGATKLFDYYIGALFTSQNHGEVEIALLHLLCTWSDQCLEINELIFSKYATNLLAYLVQMTRDQNVNPIARGLATYYMALVLELLSNPPTPPVTHSRNNARHSTTPSATSAPTAVPPPQPFSSPIITAAVLLDLITKQVSLDRFKTNLATLQSSPPFLHAESLKDGKLANPLAIYRQLELEWSSRGVNLASSAAVSVGARNFRAREEPEKETALMVAMYEMLSFSPAFLTRFKLVQDKCDQRLLFLFTSAASAPIVTNAPTGLNTVMQPTHPTSTPSPTPIQSQQQSHLPPLHTSDSLTTTPNDVQSLKEENIRLKQELDAWRSSSNGNTNESMYHFQQLQRELQQLKQQLHQTQTELQAARAVGPTSSTLPPSSTTTLGAPNVELTQLRSQYAELLSEHEDLLILLASQEIELEQAKKSTSSTAQSIATPTHTAHSTAPSVMSPATSTPTSTTRTVPPVPSPYSSLSIQPASTKAGNMNGNQGNEATVDLR